MIYKKLLKSFIKSNSHTYRYIHTYIHDSYKRISLVLNNYCSSHYFQPSNLSNPSSHAHHRPQSHTWSWQRWWSHYWNTSHHWKCFIKTCYTTHQLRHLLKKLFLRDPQNFPNNVSTHRQVSTKPPSYAWCKWAGMHACMTTPRQHQIIMNKLSLKAFRRGFPKSSSTSVYWLSFAWSAPLNQELTLAPLLLTLS